MTSKLTRSRYKEIVADVIRLFKAVQDSLVTAYCKLDAVRGERLGKSGLGTRGLFLGGIVPVFLHKALADRRGEREKVVLNRPLNGGYK